MISARLPLLSFLFTAATFGVALSAGCNTTPKTLPVSLGQGGDDCCFGNGNGNGSGNGNVTGVGSTGTGVNPQSYCDKWVSQCPNDTASPQSAAAECHALCEQGQQLTNAFCYDSACEVELGICVNAPNAGDLLTQCAQAHGWLSAASTSSGFGGASNVSSTGVGPGPSSTGVGQSSNTGSTVGQGPAASTGSGGVCDNSGVCMTCQTCAEAGPCSGAYAACNNNADCVTFSNCYAACQPGDMACATTCENASPNGVNDYVAFAQCVICDFCSVDCDGPNSGC